MKLKVCIYTKYGIRLRVHYVIFNILLVGKVTGYNQFNMIVIVVVS